MLADAMGYFDWHERPGYFRDITCHFSVDAQILDIGCGTAWLAEDFPRYTGLDPAPEAVAAATASGRTVVLGSADEPLPFDATQFDGVILKDVLEHLDHPALAVREALRVLRPGGLVFASSPDAQRWVWNDYTHKRPYSRTAFRKLFADQGFEINRCGFESVMPGTSILSRRTGNRRPLPLRAAAWLPAVRRNVWILAQRPED
jgi:SAM-dependent methyltransferase